MKSVGDAIWTKGPVPVLDPAYLTPLLAASSDLAFVVSGDGTILSILTDGQSDEHDRLKYWDGHQMEDFLTVESVPKLNDALAAVTKTGFLNKLVELNHTDGTDWQYPVRYSFYSVGPDGSTLMLGKDLRLVAEAQEQLVQAQIALERGYEERREHDARYRIVMSSTQDAFVFVGSDGRIRDVNPAATALLGASVDALVGTPIAKEFKNRRRGELVETLLNVAMSDFETDLTLQSVRSQIELKITPNVFRAAGERLILCRLSTKTESPVTPDGLQQDMAALFQKGTDAIVFCDAQGMIVEANEAFLDMTDVPSAAGVKATSFGEFLQRGQVDLNVMIEHTLSAGHMRVYATRLNSASGSQANVEISSVLLNQKDPARIGFVLRDTDRSQAIRSSVQSDTSAVSSNYNVVELVGSATLKEIVAETNDVIEKMCIETAIDLTRNNRAAAAEMLGVSRQSLYVKLRKYGLIKRDED